MTSPHVKLLDRIAGPFVMMTMGIIQFLSSQQIPDQCQQLLLYMRSQKDPHPLRGPAETLLRTGRHLQAAMLKTISAKKSLQAHPKLSQNKLSMASAAAQHAHHRLHLLPSFKRNSMCMHMLGHHTAHTSCAVALVAPAEALAAWEIVSVAALVLQHSAYLLDNSTLQ